MTAVAVVTVQPATQADVAAFRRLLVAHLREMRTKGSEIQPTDRTADFYCGLFDRYVGGGADGVVVMADDVGFSMAGDATLPLDSDFGKTAIGWGTYVVPGERGAGLGNELRRVLRAELRERGFQTVLGGTHIGDLVALASVRHTGWRPYQLQGYDDLRRGD